MGHIKKKINRCGKQNKRMSILSPRSRKWMRGKLEETVAGKLPEPMKYWVGQKVRSSFSITSYGKTRTNSLANPVRDSIDSESTTLSAEPEPNKIIKQKVFFCALPILGDAFLIFKHPLPGFQMPISSTLSPTYSSSLDTHPHPNQSLQDTRE